MVSMDSRRPRIFHVENDPTARLAIKTLANKFEFDIALTAGSVVQALPCIPKILMEKKVNVALLDNQLEDGTGDKIAAIIRKTISGLTIVSLSAGDNIDWGDINLFKTVEISVLMNTIARAASMSNPQLL